MSSRSVKHPLFARLYTRFSAGMEKEVGEHRAALVAGLSGRVLEVGAGNGMNFARYGGGIDEVVAVEPEPYLRARAEEAAGAAVPVISVIDGNATDLPFEDDSFDTVIFCLVLCSIDDPDAAIAEARRVLKPDGTVRFLEHVASPRPGKARFQRLLDSSGIWAGLAGGCTCGRDTVSSLEATGLSVTDLRTVAIGPAWGHTNPHVIGRANEA